MRPLWFICNLRSGGGRAATLSRNVARFGPVLSLSDLDQAVEAAIAAGGGIVACGGDGTVSSAISSAAGRVPVGVIPLGTGNDAAHAWGWMGTHDLSQRVSQLAQAPLAAMDRWAIELPDGAHRAFCLYASFGWDAAVTARFHAWRSRYPCIFRSSFSNKLLYALAGALTAPRRLHVEDGAAPHPSTVIYASIPSYAGGHRFPGVVAGDQRLDRIACDASVPFLMQLKGWRAAPTQRNAAWEIAVSTPTPAQCDGEPWLAAPGCYRIRCLGQAPVLVGPGFRGG